MMFSWLKYLRSFISRKVRKQNMEWSNGVIFLIATFCPDGLCNAELIHALALLHTDYHEFAIPDNAVSTFSHHILNVVLVRDVK